MTEEPESAPGRRPVPGPSAVRSLMQRAGEAVGAARDLLEGDERAQQAMRDAYGALHADVLGERFAEVPVERLKEIVPRLPVAIEIADEARESGRKVVIFSHFRDVLDIVCTALGERALGPLNGSMPSQRRQELVDEFAKAHGHAVLVSQIQAGGVGINMQAASVILCEPQVKPTLETQAIARAHRLGQVQKVQVHRLLVADSVDERMLELLEGKAALFDAYARRSDTADAVPQARDVSQAELARRVVDTERARLGLETVSNV